MHLVRAELADVREKPKPEIVGADAGAFMKRYLPAYGGYCAYGVAQGYLVKIDPEAWTIFDGRLYLNYDRSISETWRKDVPGYVHKADGNWPRLIGKP